MTLTLDLPAQTERRLLELAEQRGQAPDEYLRALVLEHLRETEAGLDDDGDGTRLADAIARLTARTPEQAAAAREHVARATRQGKPLPPGETIFDAVAGKWPGSETDEQVSRALRKLS